MAGHARRGVRQDGSGDSGLGDVRNHYPLLLETPEPNLVERMLAAGLALLGLAESGLPPVGKGAPQKQLLAWLLCRHTAVHRRWVSQRLHMGDESRVTQTL